MTPVVPTGVNYGVASSSSWPKFIYNPIMSIMRFRRASRRLLPPCKGEHLEHERTSWHGPISPKGKPLDTHMLG